MLYKEKKLSEIVQRMKFLGDMLVPYNFPKVPPEKEDTLVYLKEYDAIVEGYSVILHYQKGDYNDHFVETLSIYSKNIPFLPFTLICKLGKAFFGEEHLSLVEFFRDGRKIYCWSICTEKATGEVIPAPYDVVTEQCQFEGFKYLYMQSNQVNFF